MFRTIVQRLGATNQSIGRFLIGCMIIGFASLIAVGIAAAIATSRSQEHTTAVVHTYRVELAIARVNVTIERAETARRGYIIAREPIYRRTYSSIVANLPSLLQALERLTVDNPRQQANVVRLKRLADTLSAQWSRTNALVDGGQGDAAARYFRAAKSAERIIALRAVSQQMTDEEQRLLRVRDKARRASVQGFYVTLIIAGALLLLVAALSLVTVLRYTRDLAASRDVLRDFADSLEEEVRDRTADLSRANEEIQRFAYIVSHDLRAPLVNVMGCTAELDSASAAIRELIDRAEATAPDIVTEEARFAAREDLPEAIGFIRTSTEKMDRLINAILKLAREGRRVIAPEPIDMVAMTGTIRASLQHRLDEQGTELIIEALPGITSDRLAIEQIFSNLVENAVKYLQPGRPGRIVVRGTRTAGRVIYEIEDNGRGIAAADHQRIFDLFRRSGNQDQPGEGIGLAHVRALAYRLGGIIDVASELGVGSTFRLSLPTNFTDLQDN